MNKSLNNNEISIIDYIRKWGGSTSHALLDPACSHFTTHLVEGVIGYRLESNCAVVFGDPVCHPKEKPKLARIFHQHCKEQGKTVVYTCISKTFAQWAIKNQYGPLIGFGHEIILDPTFDPKQSKGKHASLLRNKYNQCVRDGIVVKEYTGNDPELEQKLIDVTNVWLQSRKGAQAYLLQANIFEGRELKRWFYAEQNGAIIGLVMLNRRDAYKGWLMNLLVKLPDAPNSIPEFMIMQILDTLREEQCTFLSIGALPSSDLTTIGLGTLSTVIIAMLYKIVGQILNLPSRQRFWKKFMPRMERSYLLFGTPRIHLRQIVALIKGHNVSVFSN